MTLSPDQFRAWGWRVPFLASALLVALGLWVRLRLAETAAFSAARARAEPPRVPVALVLREHGRAAVAGTLGVVACFALYYIATAFALGLRHDAAWIRAPAVPPGPADRDPVHGGGRPARGAGCRIGPARAACCCGAAPLQCSPVRCCRACWAAAR